MKKDKETVELSKTPIAEPAHEENSPSPDSPVNGNEPCSIGYDSEGETHYRKMRDLEMKDDLAVKVLNLVNDTHTNELKELAATYLKTRFN